MFIKFGKKQHLISLTKDGAMWFNPCTKFRKWENDDGIKDIDDGGIRITAIETKITDIFGQSMMYNNASMGFVVKPAYKTPVFCMYQTDEGSSMDLKTIEKQFPDYDTALVIQDEKSFLENIRKSFRSRAFCHKVFYQDIYTIDYVEFLKNGKSDTSFYEPKKRNRYYAEIRYEPVDCEKKENVIFRIDDSNYYKTMYVKHAKYSAQQEYRIVLPYETIDSGRVFNIKSFDAELIDLNHF